MSALTDVLANIQAAAEELGRGERVLEVLVAAEPPPAPANDAYLAELAGTAQVWIREAKQAERYGDPRLAQILRAHAKQVLEILGQPVGDG